MKYYTVYKITNIINGKFYIGFHITNDLNDSYMGSGKLIKQAINKYGTANFIKDILYIFDNPEQMKLCERILVVPDSKTNYNLKLGGEGGFDHIDYDARIPWNKGKIYKRNTPAWNKGLSTPRSKESKEKQRQTLTGKKRGSYNNFNHSASSKSIVIDGIEYASLAECHRETGIGIRIIRRLAHTQEQG